MGAKQKRLTISIGICTYRRPERLRACVESILDQSVLPDKIIVFDSSEDAESEKALEEFQGDLLVYRATHRRTILPVARNEVLKICNTDLVSFVDDDTVLGNRFVESVRAAFEEFPDLGGVTGPTISADDDLQPLFPIRRDARNLAVILPWGEVRSETRRWAPPRAVWCGAMIGANMSYRASDLRNAGWFDEKYESPSFREESDIQMRLARSGKKFLYHPDVFAHHIIGSSGGIEDIEAKQNEYFYRAGKNHRYFADKYFPKILTRLSWLFWSRNPPCLWLAALRTLLRRGKPNYLYWHKGLWE